MADSCYHYSFLLKRYLEIIQKLCVYLLETSRSIIDLKMNKVWKPTDQGYMGILRTRWRAIGEVTFNCLSINNFLFFSFPLWVFRIKLKQLFLKTSNNNNNNKLQLGGFKDTRFLVVCLFSRLIYIIICCMIVLVFLFCLSMLDEVVIKINRNIEPVFIYFALLRNMEWYN